MVATVASAVIQVLYAVGAIALLNKEFAEAPIKPAGSQRPRYAGINYILPFTRVAMELIAFLLFLFFSIVTMALKDITTALVAILSE